MSARKPSATHAYANAGVDIDAAEALVNRFAELAKSARRPEVLADVGPFAGLFKLGSYREPVLVASTDSVGTKVKLAALAGRYDTVGHDLVNHCVNDALTSGGEPLFFLDYIGNTGLTDDAKADIVRGCVEACKAAGCSLLGGETADMPGTYRDGDFDLVGFIVSVVERDAIIDGSAISEGDVLLALPSSGLHTNGYSLVRKIFQIGQDEDPVGERERLMCSYNGLEGTLADALLAPHRCYLDDLRPVLGQLNGIAHITGGGIPGNVPRILPDGLGASIDRGSWRVPAIFRLIQKTGDIDDEEMFRAFNMGVGIVLAVNPDIAGEVQDKLAGSWVIGEVTDGKGVEWAS
ncbi:MAG: phosphoribosylformylglycinamidine cyclo-ligase [Chloroflexota bacterium]